MDSLSPRKRPRLVPPETTRSNKRFVVLPAVAPQTIVPDAQPHVAVAAMAELPKVPSMPKIPSVPSVTSLTNTLTGETGAVVRTQIGGTPADFVDEYKGQDPKGMGGAKSHSTGRSGDPDVAYAFTVKIGNVAYAMFSEISGLSWKAEPIPVRSGGNNEYNLNMRGPGKFEPLTLKRGWFASTGEFFDMLKESLTGEAPRGSAQTGRVNVTISVLDRKYKEIGNYDFTNAFIIEYSGPSLNSMQGQVGFEQIRMAYDYFTYKPK